MAKIISLLLLMASFLFTAPVFSSETLNIPILCYHNFNPTVPGSMSLTPNKFESQIKWLLNNGFHIIPLQEAVDYLQGKRGTLPEKSIVITVDDGWLSQYKYLLPIAQKYKIPMTLFIYPETISHGKNSMTWEELQTLQKTGLFDIQSHTYSHPNFKIEKRHRSGESYDKFVNRELVNSKKILEEKMGKTITLLAWPFGIYDKYLEEAATKAGYAMAFSIDARQANKNFRPMAQPRFMIIDKLSTQYFQGVANGAKRKTYVTQTEPNKKGDEHHS